MPQAPLVRQDRVVLPEQLDQVDQPDPVEPLDLLEALEQLELPVPLEGWEQLEPQVQMGDLDQLV